MSTATNALSDVSRRPGDELAYALRGLGTAAAVLHVGVHPDDEDVGLIAYLARGRSARTVYWSATRGEGSANRIGSERGEALGVLRTWESLAARAVDGGEVLYGPFFDFGFSKTAVDTFARWPREEVVQEVARAIRLVQPMVVISRWNGDQRDGHGQHQAVGQTVRDAWDLAADPSALTSLGLPAWRPRKLYRSLGGDWQPGEDATPGELVPEHEQAGHLRIDTGQVDPLSGRSFQELGHLALNQHRTQGMAFAPQRGPYYYYYQRELDLGESLEHETDFFDGLQPRLVGLAEAYRGGGPELRDALARADTAIDAAVEDFRPGHTVAAGEALLDALAALGQARAQTAGQDSLVDADARLAVDRLLGRKEQDVAAVAARCLGLSLECLLDRHAVTPGARLRVASRVWNDGAVDARVAGIRLELPPQWTAQEVAAADSPNGAQAATAAAFEVAVAPQRWTASPYWLRVPRRTYRYSWPRHGPLSLALDPPLMRAWADVEVAGHTLPISAPAVHRRAVPGGVGELPLNVLPPIALEPRERRVLLPVDAASTTLELPLVVRCLSEGEPAATVGVAAPSGWKADPATVELSMAAAGVERTIDFSVTVPAGAAAGTHSVRYLVVTGGAPHGVELEPVRLGLGPAAATEATCVAEAFVTRPSAVEVHLIDARFVADHRYAYVPGLADEIVPSLERFALDIEMLEGEKLAFAELDRFDAIVIGPNAYNASPSVRANAPRLLEYVHGGGTLLVQHQTYGYDEDGLAPYPFTYSQPHDRVTLPDAPVEVLSGEHAIFNAPNRIGPDDWQGWVHDRGMYFFGSWDERYTPLLSWQDPGETPRLGGLMVASYGRGTYVYAGISFFRQIPAGVPGAVRLFANLLGLAESRVHDRARRLRAEPMLGFLSDEELATLARWVSERSVPKGAALVSAGDAQGALCIGVDVELEVSSSDGQDGQRVRVAAAGEPAGAYDALREAPVAASVRTRDAGRVLELRGEVLRDWLCADPDLARRLVGSLADELSRRASA